MKITIKETNDIQEITIIDPKTGLDYARDFIGNNEIDLEFDDEGNIIMTEEACDYWFNLCSHYEKADHRCYRMKDDLNNSEYTSFLDDLTYEISQVDLETTPDVMNQICDKYEPEKVMIYNENCASAGNVHHQATSDCNWEHGDSSCYSEKDIPRMKELLEGYGGSQYNRKVARTLLEYFGH